MPTFSPVVEHLLGAVLGGAVGFTGGVAGIGGAPFVIIGLVLGLGYDQFLAQGTTSATMLGPMSIMGVYVMYDRVKVLKSYIAVGVVTYAILSYVGARVAYLLSADGMGQLFGIFIALVGLRGIVRGVLAVRAEKKQMQMERLEDETGDGSADPAESVELESATKPAAAGAAAQAAAPPAGSPRSGDDSSVIDVDKEMESDNARQGGGGGGGGDNDDGVIIVHDNAEYDEKDIGDSAAVDPHKGMNADGLTYASEPPVRLTLMWMFVLSGATAFVGGLFGVGGGVVIVPALTTIFHVHKDDARAISLTMLCPPVSIGAVLAYQAEGDVKWSMAAVQLVSYMATNYPGAVVGRKMKPRLFGHVLNGMLFFVGVVMIALAVIECDGSCF